MENLLQFLEGLNVKSYELRNNKIKTENIVYPFQYVIVDINKNDAETIGKLQEYCKNNELSMDLATAAVFLKNNTYYVEEKRTTEFKKELKKQIM